MRTGVGVVVVFVTALAVALSPSAGADSGQLRAGAAVVDASWHVGASAGQYASDGAPIGHEDGTFDPTANSTRRLSSYGIQSKLQARALVIEGPDGTRTAFVKNDLYIPQDLLWRRVAQILEQDGTSGIGHSNLTMNVTHDHSSPYYSSTSWGAWTFQDVFDIRFYEYYAHQMAKAVEQAADSLKPARVGAAVTQFDKTHRHSFGPAIADDGTPAGYPRGDADHDMTVIRFDDISDAGHPKPLANLVNFALHGEGLEGNDLISADWVAPLQKMLDSETGAINVFTQGSVGTAEPERSEWHSIHERLEFSHRDYAQGEFAARLMADSFEKTWNAIGDGAPGDSADPARFVPYETAPPVKQIDRWYPGPFSHPYPGVSNCRTDKLLAMDPQIPIVGLPDCTSLAGGLNNISDLIGGPEVPDVPLPIDDPGLSTDNFQSIGIPVPENYGAPGYTGLEEDIDVHLQAIKIGDILLTICSCEQWKDQSFNIKTRTDRTPNNEYVGYDWGAQCTDNGDGTWTCPNPGNTAVNLPPIPDHEYQRMRAQVNNPANDWNKFQNILTAESEPTNTTQIKGNYTHDDDQQSADLGYKLTVPISMANDYNGYIATYREYQRGDHYRKALTGWGPHSSDYMASRLVTMGRQMQDPGVGLPIDQQQEVPLATKATVDQTLNNARAQALGTGGDAAIAAYDSTLPDDGGGAVITQQPGDVERFGATYLKWNGGSNYTDNPDVRVERKVGDDWVPYADEAGAIPVTLKFPQTSDAPAYLLGDQHWEWTAHFEAFGANFKTQEGTKATPAGTYRFTVDGERRQNGGHVDPYHLVSDEFDVKPWPGITVDDFRLEGDNTLSFKVGPRHTYNVSNGNSEINVQGGGPDISAEIGPIDYPDSYDSPARFIRDKRWAFRDPAAPGDPTKLEWFCFTCTFRPWADSGDAQTAEVTVNRDGGGTDTIAAHEDGDRWVTDDPIDPGDTAFVAIGGVKDEFGDINGAQSSSITRAGGGGGGAKPKMFLHVNRHRGFDHVRYRFRFRVTSASPSCRGGVTVSLGRFRVLTRASGRNGISRRFKHSGHKTAFARKHGCQSASVGIVIRHR